MQHPNVLLVVLDCVRAHNTSLHGYRRETTPTLSRLAETATTYTQARTPAGWSLPAHASLFTGVSPAAHRMAVSDRLTEGHTVFERLAEQGYETAVFSENPYLTVHPSDLRLAFDEVVTETDEETGEYSDGVDGYWYADRFAEWVRERDRAEPWAACVNLMDAHMPYTTREEHDRWGDDLSWLLHDELPQKWRWAVYGDHAPASLVDTLVRLYDGAIRQADDVVDRLWTTLVDEDAFDDTLVVVTADHGDGFGEPAALDAEPMSLMHGMGTQELLYHVPLVVKAPGQTDGRRETSLATLERFPSVVDAARASEGTEADPGWFVADDGRAVSYLPPADGQEAEKARRHTTEPERYIQESAIVYQDAPGDRVYKHAAWGDDTYTAEVWGTCVRPLEADVDAFDTHPLAIAREIADAFDRQLTEPLSDEEARLDKYDTDDELGGIDVEKRLRDLGYL